jgi:hypothetical protein
LIGAGLLFRQGVPPHGTYLFKHALVQDAAYGMLLREPTRSLHARIAVTIESQYPDVVENQPELLARHCTEAGSNEKAARFWGKAGLRSLAAEHRVGRASYGCFALRSDLVRTRIGAVRRRAGTLIAGPVNANRIRVMLVCHGLRLRHWGYRRRLRYRALEAEPTAPLGHERPSSLIRCKSAFARKASI